MPPKLITATDAELVFVTPLRTGGGLNEHEHWRLRKKRKDRERWMVMWAFLKLNLRALPPPVDVTLVRLSPSWQLLDDDNLVAGMKSVRDEVAAQLHVDDGDRARIRFTYDQETKAPDWGVRIEIRRRQAEAAA